MKRWVVLGICLGTIVATLYAVVQLVNIAAGVARAVFPELD